MKALTQKMIMKCPEHNTNRGHYKDDGSCVCFDPVWQERIATAKTAADNYGAESEKLLAELPPELRSAVSYMAYERGHSAGFEEVLGILKNLVYELKGPIGDLITRIRSEKKGEAS